MTSNAHAGAYDQAREMLKLELDASSSINSRGASLAALVGVTIALTANFARLWTRADLPLSWTIAAGASALVAAFALLGAMSFALAASAPDAETRTEWERWRAAVLDAYNGSDVQRTAQLAEALQARFEQQAGRNNTKATRMGKAYWWLAAGVALVAAHATATIVGLGRRLSREQLSRNSRGGRDRHLGPGDVPAAFASSSRPTSWKQRAGRYECSTAPRRGRVPASSSSPIRSRIRTW